MRKTLAAVSKRKSFRLRSEGNSMYPILQSGDLVLYKRTVPSSLKEDDIVLVKGRRSFFTHRIIYKQPSFLVTKGDSNPNSDGKIKYSQILGKAVAVERRGKKLSIEDVYTIQSIHYLNEILNVTATLRRKKIRFAILKGLPLHMHYEGRHPRRLYNDCDILIHPSDEEKTVDILTKKGYKKIDSSYSVLHKKFKDKKTEETFYKGSGSVLIVFDVHYELVFMMNQLGRLEELYPQKHITQMSEDSLRNAKEIVVDGVRVPILCETDLIIYLGLHFFHHNFTGLFRLHLMDRIIRKMKGGDKAFVSIKNKVQSLKLSGFLFPAFLLLKQYYDTPLPKEFMKEISPSSFQKLYAQNVTKEMGVFEEETRLSSGIERFKNLFFLSPYPFAKKILVFFTPAVLYSILWTFLTQVKALVLKLKVRLFKSSY